MKYPVVLGIIFVLLVLRFGPLWAVAVTGAVYALVKILPEPPELREKPSDPESRR